MNRKFVHAIGLMSGTSLDGLDIVYVRFANDKEYSFEILQAETVFYSQLWKDKLQNAYNLTPNELQILDVEYGRYLGKKVVEFIQKNQILELDFVASHGHTVFHEPDKGISLQIGNGSCIVEQVQKTVVCDFRKQDVQLGGQGAPLVPVGDRLLFTHYDACVNLGGFANISFEQESKRIAFDVCPVNVVLNHYSKLLGKSYDDKGSLARMGKINSIQLASLNTLEYYHINPPKSLGIEWVHKNVFPILEDSFDEKEALRTFMEHSAMQIAFSIDSFDSVLFTGGGVYNDFLMERIRFYSNANIEIPENAIIDYKEALIFAFLGLLRLKNEVNCLSSVTGAKYDHSSGKIFNFN